VESVTTGGRVVKAKGCAEVVGTKPEICCNFRVPAVVFGACKPAGGQSAARRGLGKMDEPRAKGKKHTTDAIDASVREYVGRLSDEHRMLVVLKGQLYGGSWEPMLDDLRNRLVGKPYIFKLVNRIKDDIERIEEMRRFEVEHHIDLVEYVELA